MGRRSKKRGFRSVIYTVLFLVAVIGIYLAYRMYSALYAPNTRVPQGTEAFVYVRSTDGYSQMMGKLKSSGFIQDFESFEFVAQKKGLDKQVRPGKYRISDGMSNGVLVNMFKAGNQVPVRVQLNREANLAEIAGTLSRQLEADSLALITLLTNEDTARYYGFTSPTIIALFIPNTYEFFWAITPRKILGRFKSEYDKVWTAERLEKAAVIGYSKEEVATLASIVAQETGKREESARIAGVYINRLKAGIALQADPTLRFAAKDPTIHRVLNIHKAIDSPYNTYINKGLPPGPIGLASIDFIDAVLNYEHHNYLYFCAKDDFSGYSNFTASYQEHQQNARKYQRALTQRGIMN